MAYRFCSFSKEKFDRSLEQKPQITNSKDKNACFLTSVLEQFTIHCLFIQLTKNSMIVDCAEV